MGWMQNACCCGVCPTVATGGTLIDMDTYGLIGSLFDKADEGSARWNYSIDSSTILAEFGFYKWYGLKVHGFFRTGIVREWELLGANAATPVVYATSAATFGKNLSLEIPSSDLKEAVLTVTDASSGTAVDYTFANTSGLTVTSPYTIPNGTSVVFAPDAYAVTDLCYLVVYLPLSTSDYYYASPVAGLPPYAMTQAGPTVISCDFSAISTASGYPSAGGFAAQKVYATAAPTTSLSGFAGWEVALATETQEVTAVASGQYTVRRRGRSNPTTHCRYKRSDGSVVLTFQVLDTYWGPYSGGPPDTSAPSAGSAVVLTDTVTTDRDWWQSGSISAFHWTW